jgi:hypothetical protein
MKMHRSLRGMTTLLNMRGEDEPSFAVDCWTCPTTATGRQGQRRVGETFRNLWRQPYLVLGIVPEQCSTN